MENLTVRIHIPDSQYDKLLMVAEGDTIRLRTDSLIGKLVSKYGREYNNTIPTPEMWLYGSNNRVDLKLQLQEIYFNVDHDSLKVSNMIGNLLVRKK